MIIAASSNNRSTNRKMIKKERENKTRQRIKTQGYDNKISFFVMTTSIIALYSAYASAAALATTLSSTTKQNSLSTSSSSMEEELHLISLPPLPSLNTFQSSQIKYYPPILRQAWKWKDDTLGNGRDYILPKPRALHDFNSLLIGQSFTFSTSNNDVVEVTVEECATLSNCARLDILLATKTNIVPHNSSSLVLSSSLLPSIIPISKTNEAMKYIVSNCLVQQIYQQSKATNNSQKSSSWGNDLKRFFDLPGVVQSAQQINSDTINNSNKEYQNDLEELYTNLKQTKLLPKIITHYALIASGMPISHPSRPDTASLTFRPYSSRDAHILCQLKRCLEVANGTKVTLVLQEALRAGKASRDESIVEEILMLKKYGSGKSRFGDGDVPLDLSKMAAKAAKEKAIKPSIKRCLEKLNALNASSSISSLRQKADVLLQTFLTESSNGNRIKENSLRKRINTILHQPCIDLREGKKNVVVENVLDDIQRELESMVDSEVEEVETKEKIAV